MKIKYLILLIIGLFTLQLPAQEYLYLLKKGTTKSKKLLLKDVISVKVKGADNWTKGEITSLYPNQLELDYNLLYSYDTISDIRITRKTQKQFGKGFRKAAIFYSGILLINGAITESNPLIPKNHAIAAVSLYAFGWALHLTSKSKYSLEDWRVEYINLNFLE